ncbi:hypothetical protein [Streptomyces sp. NPDC029674]|uniref:hypothetical protein n=1 Tax=Streptomyces sp. NPDC029674 TaxID=3365297 RepID=UPI00384C703D
MEEEFALTDVDSGAPLACASAVLARTADSRPPEAGAFHSELLATMVESTTGICSTLA